MFERFHQDARQSVVLAQEEAHRLRHGFIGCEHLLLGLAAYRTGPAADALAAVGLDLANLRERVGAEYAGTGNALDADALALLGIDLDEVRRSAEAAFGPGALDRPPGCRGSARHIPFTPRAKKSLELALREAVRLKHREISSGHVLLGILREGGNMGTKLIADAGVRFDDLRNDVVRRLSAAA
jgi:ATP-dependent Clp protease ATP-binding subunit ClpA